jgi:hypothetical protein
MPRLPLLLLSAGLIVLGVRCVIKPRALQEEYKRQHERTGLYRFNPFYPLMDSRWAVGWLRISGILMILMGLVVAYGALATEY